MIVLTPEQQEAVDWMAAREDGGGPPHGGLLADDVGLGKTAVVACLVHAAPLWPTLIVVPKSTLCDWVDTLHRASVGRGRLLVRVVARRGCAAPVLAESFAVVVATTPIFGGADRGEAARRLAECAWGRVVVDEAHDIRNPRTQLHRRLRDLRAHARWAVTATPIQNVQRDMLALAAFVGVHTEDAALVRERYMMRRTRADDDASLPPLTVRNVRVPMRHAAERELYAACAAASSASGSAQGSPLHMELQLRCLQACTHPAVYHRSMAGKAGLAGQDVLRHLGAATAALRDPLGRSSKLDHLCADLVAGRVDAHRALVFCEWTSEMDVLEAMLRLLAPDMRVRRLSGDMGVDERRDVCRDPGEALLVQTRCGGCGVNLQAADRVYFTRPHWNPAVELQAIGRAHRRGQLRPVAAMRYVAVGTVDEQCLARQACKLEAMSVALADACVQRRLTGREAADGLGAACC